jgi:hypothetical protein
MTPGDEGEEKSVERLVRNDREYLSAFVENLNKGVGFDDMDDELKSWWLNRY